jgi:hypothetical protein
MGPVRGTSITPVALVAREERRLALTQGPPNALKIEDEVWEAVKAMLLDPERLERGLNAYLKAEVEKDGGILKRKVGYL